MRWNVGIVLLLFSCWTLSTLDACGPSGSEPVVEATPEVRQEVVGADAEASLPEPAAEPAVEMAAEPIAEPPPTRDAAAEPIAPPERVAESAPEDPSDAQKPPETPGEEQGEGMAPCGGRCASWQACMADKCEAKACTQEDDCGADGTCVKGTCRSLLECCKPGSTQCAQEQEQRCVVGADGCGKYSTPAFCQTDSSCHRGACQLCRHREATNGTECCQGTRWEFGYCLVLCDQTKGELDNPDCQMREFCFPLGTGTPAVCLPDGNEPKGANCSIVKPCGSGLSCVNVMSQGFQCFTDCSPSKGGVGNPDCTAQEQCGQVVGSTLGGICVPIPGQTKKLHEACDQSNPCQMPNLCIGEPGSGKTYCLAPCDPTANPSTCPANAECAGYDAMTPTKGVCLEKCSVAGTVDTCTYGECRAKGQDKFCL